MGGKWIKRTRGVPGLTDRARLVLRCMADYALDYPRDGYPAGVYFGGWDVLARVGLGYVVPDDGTFGPDTYPAAYRAVARAVAELIDAGWIKPLPDKVNRHRAYELLV